MVAFRRRYDLRVGNQSITAHALSFTVERQIREPDTMEFTILNVSEDLRRVLQEQNSPLTLEAGYADQISLLYEGFVRRSEIFIEPPDSKTTISCGDGDDIYQKDSKAFTFQRGTSLIGAIETLFAALGAETKDAIRDIKTILAANPGIVAVRDAQNQEVDPNITPATARKFRKGLTVQGPTHERINKLLDLLKIQWTVQDGIVFVAQERRPSNAFSTTLVIEESTGMIGSPRTGEDGVITVKTLLNPGIRPLREIQLNSLNLSGNYVVQRVTHTGDTESQEWFSEFEAVEVVE